MSVFYLTFQKQTWWDSRIDKSPGSTKDQKIVPFFTSTFFFFPLLIPDRLDGSPICVCTQRTECLRSLAPVAFSTLPGSSFHNIMITVPPWGWRSKAAVEKWCSHTIMWGKCRIPLHCPSLASFSQLTKGKEGEKCLLLPAALKLWLESARCAKYHSCIRQSMTWLPESWDQSHPPCSHCRLLLFFSQGHALQSFFFFFPLCWA